MTARRELTERQRQLVDAAPPLSDDQRRKIAAVLRSAASRQVGGRAA